MDGGYLQWPDWLAIGLMLAASAAIGVYYRFTGGKQKTAEVWKKIDEPNMLNRK